MTQPPRDAFGASALVPLVHGAEGRWLHALHGAADALAAIALIAIMAGIAVALRGRADLPPRARRAGLLFMLLLALAAASHVAAMATVRVPAYGVEALAIAAAVVAVLTAVAIWPLIPKLLALPSPRDLARANAALVEANASLETAVAQRTRELEVARARFEQALTDANVTVFTQDRELRYTWIHDPTAPDATEAVIGRTSAGTLPPDGADEAFVLKRRVLATGRAAGATVAVIGDGGQRGFIDMTASPTRDASGAVDGILCTAVDVTEKRLFGVRVAAMAAQLAQANQRFELALEDSAMSMFEQDAELRYTWVYNPPRGTGADDFLGRRDGEIFRAEEARRLVPPKKRVLASGEREAFEIEVEIGGEPRFFVVRLEARTDEAGKPEAVVMTALDLTDRRRDEMRMRLMMRELTHRSKNLLAVIQAMARKTASLSDDTDTFVADFSSRLRSMAAAHDLLVSQSWHGADLGELIRASVAQTIAPTAEQVRIAGPPLMLAPDTAQNLGLAFHELATNASKYGALAADGGRIDVSWRREDGEIRVRWEESGGPEVAPPTRRGFGRVLLEQLVGATLNGSVALHFRPSGVTCDIVFPDDPSPAA